MRALVLFGVLVIAGGPASAAALDLPTRMPGLWEVRGAMSGAGGGPAMRECVDAKTDDPMKERFARMGLCGRPDIERTGDRIVATYRCKLDETTATMRGEFVGSFDSVTEARIRTYYDPPLQGVSETPTLFDARRLGPCPPGQRPGDVPISGAPDHDAIRKDVPNPP